MIANCFKVMSDTYYPSEGAPVPMVIAYLDIEGFQDPVKVQISKKKVEGDPAPGQVYVDFGPRYGNGGKVYWKPALLRFAEKS